MKKRESDDRPRGGSVANLSLQRRLAELLLGDQAPEQLPKLRLAGTDGSDPLEGLRSALGQLPGIVVRRRELTYDSLSDITRAGARVMFATGEGTFLVVTAHRVFRISADAERKSRLSRSAFKGAALPRQGLIVERELGLETLGGVKPGKVSPWIRLAALLRLEAKELVALAVYAIVLGGLSLAVPVAVQVLVNTIALGSLLQPLVILSLLLCGVLAFSAAVQTLEWYAVEVLQRRLFARVAEDFARRLPRVSRSHSDRIDLAELTNRFFEIASVQKAAGLLVIEGFGFVLQTTTGLLLLAFYHPALLVFDTVLLAAVVLALLLGRGAVKSATAESAAKYHVGAWLQDMASAPVLLKRERARLASLHIAQGLTQDYLSSRKRHYRSLFRQYVAGAAIQVLSMVVLLGLGGWLVGKGELTLGQLVAAELVVASLGSGFVKLGKHFELGYDLLAGLDKLGTLLDLPTDKPRLTRAPLAEGELLQIERLQISGTSGETCREISASVREGARAWLVGPPGVGKSLLLETVAGLRDSSAGRLCFNTHSGVENADDIYLLRPRDVATGTILHNLQLGCGALNEEEAWKLLAEVHLDKVVRALDDGLNTVLSRNGAPLSASQVARLAAARAIAARPHLLLYDGRLSELGNDDAERAAVVDALLGEKRPWTTIVASDELDTGVRCTQILELSADGERNARAESEATPA